MGTKSFLIKLTPFQKWTNAILTGLFPLKVYQSFSLVFTDNVMMRLNIAPIMHVRSMRQIFLFFYFIFILFYFFFFFFFCNKQIPHFAFLP